MQDITFVYLIYDQNLEWSCPIIAVLEIQVPYWPYLRRPLLALLFLEWRLRASIEKTGVKGPTILDFSPSSGTIIHLLRYQKKGLGRGGDAVVCKCTQVRNTSHMKLIQQ